MTLDISTLYLLACLVATLLGVMLLYISRKEKIAALNWWGAAYLVGAVAVAAWTLFGSSFGSVLSYIVGAVGIFACGMVWNAARVFHGKRPAWLGVALGVVGWVVASIIVPDDALSVRITIGAAIVAIYAVVASSELWSERRRAMHRRWPALAVPLLHGSVLLLPVLIGDILASDPLLQQNQWATLFAFELVLYAIGTVFVVIMLVSERTVGIHKTAASTDALTELFNRRGFTAAAETMMARRARIGEPVSLLLFDLDRFKSINDRFGHPAGDEILKMFAATLSRTLRTTDLYGRLGGEEFVALLPCASVEAAIAAERVREAFAASDVAVDDTPVDTTVSIGIATGGPQTELDTLLATADVALYRAKANGRNRIETAADNGPETVAQTDREATRRTVVVSRGRIMDQMSV